MIEHTAATLNAIGEVTERLGRLRQALAKRPEVTHVTAVCRPEPGDASPTVEWFVDADFRSGDALSWGLWLYRSGDGWIIAGELQRIHQAGSDTERRLPERRVANEDLARALAAAADELAALEVPTAMGNRLPSEHLER